MEQRVTKIQLAKEKGKSVKSTWTWINNSVFVRYVLSFLI